MKFPQSSTEKTLVAVIGVVMVAFFVHVLEKDTSSVVMADEKSEKSQEEESEKSEGKEESEKSEYEEGSEYGELSEESEYYEQNGTIKNDVQKSVTVPATLPKENSAMPVSETAPTLYQNEGNPEMNVLEEGSMGEIMKEESNQEEKMTELPLEGYEEYTIMSREENRVRVQKEERLFGIFTIQTESELEVDDEGKVVQEKKTFFSSLLSFLSF